MSTIKLIPKAQLGGQTGQFMKAAYGNNDMRITLDDVKQGMRTIGEKLGFDKFNEFMDKPINIPIMTGTPTGGVIYATGANGMPITYESTPGREATKVAAAAGIAGAVLTPVAGSSVLWPTFAASLPATANDVTSWWMDPSWYGGAQIISDIPVGLPTEIDDYANAFGIAFDTYDGFIEPIAKELGPKAKKGERKKPSKNKTSKTPKKETAATKQWFAQKKRPKYEQKVQVPYKAPKKENIATKNWFTSEK